MRPANATVGQVFPRSKWLDIEREFSDQFCKKGSVLRFVGPKTSDGRSYLVHLNCHYRGPYGPEQAVEFRGYLVTVWAKEGLESCAEVVTTADEVPAAVERLGAKADAKCHHPHATRIAYRNCLTTYHCPDCGTTYDIDSSG